MISVGKGYLDSNVSPTKFVAEGVQLANDLMEGIYTEVFVREFQIACHSKISKLIRTYLHGFMKRLKYVLSSAKSNLLAENIF